jgi:3-mercaptopyruvate sulfurtransferase SseA
MLVYLGINPGKKVYSHCGGGIAASVPFFAIKYLCGYSNVKLFPGSELEWISDQRELPFWTYDAPFLIRDGEWLKSWGGKMMRMYGISHVSLIDVRSSELFGKGHVEYSISIPSDVFRNNISNKNKIAEELSRADVDASSEAVIISGGGLTKEAALAFMMFEKLGQKNISLFMSSADKWEHIGFKVIKDTNTLVAKRTGETISGPASIYKVQPRDGIIVNDLKSTKGIYTKVFIASGTNIPSKAPDGRVLHVPYTDFLNTDGMPKTAKDIWSILSKAGVPRYGEIICYSDDPGDAAINYFILKLMGFPDIKIEYPF